MKTSKIDPDAIGVEVSWGFGFGDAEAVTLRRIDMVMALGHAGFDPDLVDKPTADQALRRAKNTVKGRSTRIVIQELRRPNNDTPRAFGVYKVIANDGESGDHMVMGARARVQGGMVVCLPPEGETVYPFAECAAIGKEIERIANSLMRNVINRDISLILVLIGWQNLGWISRRRNSGGVYFVARTEVAEKFVKLLHKLEEMTSANPRGHRFIPQVMEVYAKPLTMNMWKGSATDQYEMKTTKLANDLAAMLKDDKMRESTMQARANECDALIRQAMDHRMFLEEQVEVIASQLTKVKAGFQEKLLENQRATMADLEAIDKATTV